MSEQEEQVFEKDCIADFQRERLVEELQEQARKRLTALVWFWTSLLLFLVTSIYFFHRLHEIRTKPRAGGLGGLAILGEFSQLIVLTALGLISSLILCLVAMVNLREAIYLLVVQGAVLLLMAAIMCMG